MFAKENFTVKCARSLTPNMLLQYGDNVLSFSSFYCFSILCFQTILEMRQQGSAKREPGTAKGSEEAGQDNKS